MMASRSCQAGVGTNDQVSTGDGIPGECQHGCAGLSRCDGDGGRQRRGDGVRALSPDYA